MITLTQQTYLRSFLKKTQLGKNPIFNYKGKNGKTYLRTTDQILETFYCLFTLTYPNGNFISLDDKNKETKNGGGDSVGVEICEGYLVMRDNKDVFVISNFCLPYTISKKDTAKLKFKATLQKAIDGLELEAKRNGVQYLMCDFMGEKKPNSDIENLLLYNVGVSHFKQTTQSSLTIFSGGNNPFLDYDLNNLFNLNNLFYYHYSISTEIDPGDLSNNVICEWGDMPIKCIQSNTGAEEYFKMMRGNLDKIKIYRKAKKDEKLLLCLTITKNPEQEKYLANIMKHMIDGILCALHSLPPKQMANIKSNVAFADIPFAKEDKVCLPEHNYFKQNKSREIWAPLDEMLSSIHLQFVDGDSFNISGKLCMDLREGVQTWKITQRQALIDFVNANLNREFTTAEIKSAVSKIIGRSCSIQPSDYTYKKVAGSSDISLLQKNSDGNYVCVGENRDGKLIN